MKGFNRRDFLKISSILAGGVVVSSALSACSATPRPSKVNFTHGIASGDPSASALIIWTRAEPLENVSGSTIVVNWEVADDAAFSNIIRKGSASTSIQRDYTIKVDVQDLKANTRYYYRFLAANNQSQTGKSKTLPVGSVSEVNFAIFSCSNYPAGYFTPYSIAAQMQTIDAVIHLGDYIYEHAADGYATERAAMIGREADEFNQNEVISLADYRHRYALYRTDKGLQAIHAAAPFIAVWDDHEITNDTYKNGAQNHNEGEGDFFVRRTSAIQAYYEWMPIRPPFGDSSPQIYRSFDYGDLLSLHMLDTRVIGRDQQLAYADYMNEQGQMDTASFMNDLSSERRTLLGSEQFAWLVDKIGASNSTWQIIGQQVLMGKMLFPAEILANQDRTQAASLIHQLAELKRKADSGVALSELDQTRLERKMAYNMDAWDGYPVEREKLYGLLQSHSKKVAVIAGDTHNAWCNALQNAAGETIGYEFATPAVSSPGMETYLSLNTEDSEQLAKDLPDLIDGLQYCNLHQRGLLTLKVTQTDIEAKWHFVDSVLAPESYIKNSHMIKV